MTSERRVDIKLLFQEGTAIDQAISSAVKDALRMHKMLGNPVAEWRDGKVVLIPPEEIKIDEETAD